MDTVNNLADRRLNFTLNLAILVVYKESAKVHYGLHQRQLTYG